MCDYFGCNKPCRGGKKIMDGDGQVWAKYCPLHAPNRFEDIFRERTYIDWGDELL